MDKPVTELDVNQIIKYSYEPEDRAQRVIVVNNPEWSARESASAAPIVYPETIIQKIEVPQIIKETEIKIVEVPTIVKEIQLVEIQVEKIITVPQIQIVEVPVIVKEIEYKEIIKPILVTENRIEKFPNWLKACIALQTLSFLGVLIHNLIK